MQENNGYCEVWFMYALIIAAIYQLNISERTNFV